MLPHIPSTNRLKIAVKTVFQERMFMMPIFLYIFMELLNRSEMKFYPKHILEGKHGHAPRSSPLCGTIIANKLRDELCLQ
jgi:hypothetical protein